MQQPINTTLVKQLITTQFPQWTHLPIKPVKKQGEDNRTFRLGDQMAIRLPSAERYSQQVEKEQFWLPRLAPQLPLQIPIPLAKGVPNENYPWQWSIYRWIDGETASHNTISDLNEFALTLAQFLTALQSVDATHGPIPGPHNFYRGGSLKTYDDQVKQAITILHNEIDTQAATTIWNTALNLEWQKNPVWVHGDITVDNLLVNNGKLTAVIDFGGLGVGDPACDIAIAWALFDADSRNIFRNALPLDNDTWNRGKGWALWKSLIVCAGLIHTSRLESKKHKRILYEILVKGQDSNIQ